MTLERTMHAFVHPVLIRPAGQDALVLDAEAHPPHVETGAAVNRLGGEWDAVVRPDRPRLPVLAERALNDRARGHRLGREQSMAGDQVGRRVRRGPARRRCHFRS